MHPQRLFLTTAVILLSLTACGFLPDITSAPTYPEEGNLIPDPFYIDAAADGSGTWRHDDGVGFSVVRSDALSYREGYAPPDPERLALTVEGLTGLRRAWQAPLPVCTPGESYRFTAEVYRTSWQNGVYPEVSLWGEVHRLDTTLQTGVFQPVSVHLTCPASIGRKENFRFVNPHGGSFFALRAPHLVREAPLRTAPESPKDRSSVMSDGIFPIGVYGAKPEDFPVLQEMGVNTVVVGGSGPEGIAAIRECNRLDLFYLVVSPRDPDRLSPFLETVSINARPDLLGFYVNDEPGIHAFPVSRAESVQRILKNYFPSAPTAMAVVRPQVARNYRNAADYFLLDQYPVPYMPMTWLTDSMDRVSEDLGPHRIAAVVQAFGGDEWAAHGWPRAPRWEEMDCLAFLSVIHGGRGVFFYSWPALKASHGGANRLKRVVDRLQAVYPWLVNSDQVRTPRLRMTSPNRTDYRGRPAVHCSIRIQDDQPLLLCANTIPTYTEVEVFLESSGHSDAPLWTEIFTGESYHRDGPILRSRFDPFQVRAWIPGTESE